VNECRSERHDILPAVNGGVSSRSGSGRSLEILLLDEPFGSVDARTRDRLHDELLDIWAETQQTVVFVTHDVDEAVKLADRIVVLDDDPGTVQSTLTINVDRPRERTSHEFEGSIRSDSHSCLADNEGCVESFVVEASHAEVLRCIGTVRGADESVSVEYTAVPVDLIREEIAEA